MSTKADPPESIKMKYDVKWIFPAFRKQSKIWAFASTLTVAAVGIFTKIFMGWLSKAKVHNVSILSTIIDRRPKTIPLITVSNHYSCFDDPGIWGSLNWRHIFKPSAIRWSLAAHDICFTCWQHAIFFALGKCVPVIRGGGVYQEAVNFCIEQLGKGSWIHVFPEGKVNMTKENMRFKWGIGRMILESPVTPIIVPIWHIGMDEVLPNEPPYYLHLRKKLTLNFGDPIDLTDMVKSLKEKKLSEVEARQTITDFLQEQLHLLKIKTEKLHKSNFS